MSDLREDLDRALRTVTVGEAPVERAKRDGRRLRTRRRAALLAGALTVAAVAAGYPALTRTTAATPPTPASGQKAHPSHQKPYHGDMVLTAGGGGATTQAPTGLESKTGEVASGTVGDMRWQMTVIAPGPKNPVPADPCYTITVTLAGSSMQGRCYDLPASAHPGNGDPAAFTEMSDGTNAVIVGEATQDVAYFIVTFTDGQYLKLIPVTAHGHRYVAWIAPLSMTIKSAEAHLGSAYATSGQVATAIPFEPPGQPPTFGLWQQPGQAAPPTSSAIIGSGSIGGHVWVEIGYEGPFGTCFTPGSGSRLRDCVPLRRLDTTTILSGRSGNPPGVAAFGSAAPGVATVLIMLSNHTTVQAKPVLVGNEHLFAFPVGKDLTPVGWTAYDASGKQVGAGGVATGSMSAAKSASP